MLEEDPTDLGQEAYDKGNYDLAIAYYRKAFEADPDDHHIAKRLGSTFYLISDYQSAAAVYGIAIKRLENQCKLTEVLGNLYLCLCEASLRLGHLLDAKEQVSRAVQFNADEASLRISQGNVYLALEQHKEALSEFEEHIHSNPEAIDGYVGLSRVYQRQSDFDLAVKTLMEAKILAPENSDVEIMLGNLATDTRKFSSALKHYQRANDLAPHNPTTTYSVGVGYLNLEDYKKAKQMFESVLEQCPKNSDAMYTLAHTEMEIGDEVRAIALLNSAIVIKPDNIAYHVLLTKAYLTLWKLLKAFRTAQYAKKLAKSQEKTPLLLS